MKKKTIAILLGLGFGIEILGGILIAIGVISAAAAAANCDAATYCAPSANAGGLVALFLFSYLIMFSGGVLAMISWIATLIKQAQRQQWAWFICTLLFSGICTLLWLIIEPEVPAVPQYVPVYQPIRAGYQQAYPHDGPLTPSYPTDGPYQSISYPQSQHTSYYQDPYRPQ